MRFFGLPELKIFLRSGSVSFALDRRGRGDRKSIAINGKPFFYRAGTSDTWIMLEVLMQSGDKAEYWLPSDKSSPKVILDIGANIGCTAVYFANRYPTAIIHSFEPDPANFELLSLNTAPYKNVKIYNVALGNEDGTLSLGATADSINHGAKTLVGDRHHDQSVSRVRVCEAKSFLDKARIRDQEVVKIDTEGFEYPILQSLASVASKAKWIFGELHDQHDFSALSLFEATHSIGIVRGVGQTFSPFFAYRRDCLGDLSEPDRQRLLGRFRAK